MLKSRRGNCKGALPVIRKIAAILSLSFLAGCNVDTTSTVFVTDIFKAAVKEDFITTVPIIYRIEMPSKEKCLQLGDKITPIVRKHMFDVTELQCKSEGFESFLEINAKQKLMHDTFPNIAYPGLSAITANFIDGYYGVQYAFAGKSFKAMSDELSKAIDNTASLKVRSVSLNLTNDTDQTRTIFITAAYIDGKPRMNFMHTLESKTTAAISISNVAIDIAKLAGYVWVLGIKAQ